MADAATTEDDLRLVLSHCRQGDHYALTIATERLGRMVHPPQYVEPTVLTKTEGGTVRETSLVPLPLGTDDWS